MGAVFCKEDCEKFRLEIEKCEKNSSCPWYSNVEVDWNGCRKFPRLPPPGQHPRLFFTKQEIPRIVARFTHSEMSGQLKIILDATRKAFLKDFDAQFSDLSEEAMPSQIAKDVVDKVFKVDEQRAVNILGAYVYGVMYEDNELSAKAMKAALFYARIILRSRQIAIEDNIKEEPYNVWHSNVWDLGIGWLFGGSSFALLYDLMFNDLPEKDRCLMRKAITTAVKGRRSWGMGFPTRKIQSNWASYHGDLFTLSAVVEDEEGFDDEVFTLFSDLMVHFLDYGFYDSGHPIEDSYVLNLALREGSICFLAMARRGHNIFNHPRFKKIWTNWVPYALEPHNSGRVYGGSSGSAWDYPTSAIMAKYMFPKDRGIDYIYRHYMCQKGKKFGRLLKLQSRLPALAFAIPALSVNLEEPEHPEELNLPLTFVCRDRGKVIMRSDWSENAMWLTLDARPDCFLIGHDVCSRGTFVLSAHGRSWGFCPEWKHFRESSDYSLPHINGVGQQQKAPFVKLLDVLHGESGSTFASADLTYAYNWMWSNWAKEGQDLKSRGYELEPHDPREFGYNVWWAPNKLYREGNVAIVGLNQWRKRFATVEKAFRSCVLVRASQPYVLIVDDVKKDNDIHEYTWSMTTPDDVELVSFDGTDAILAETDGTGRRFLIRSLCQNAATLGCSFRKIQKLPESANCDDKARQLILKCMTTKVRFNFLLFSLPRADSELPETRWIQDGTLLQIRNTETNEGQRILFGTGTTGACSIVVSEDKATCI